MANNEFHIYNVEKNRLTNWSKAHTDFTGTSLEKIRDCIKGVAYNPAEPKQMLIYGNTYMCLVQLTNNKDASSTQQQSDKRQKRKRDLPGGVVHQVKSPIQMQVSTRYQQILFAGFKGDNSLVLIERPRFSVLEKLPPSFYKSRYGA